MAAVTASASHSARAIYYIYSYTFVVAGAWREKGIQRLYTFVVLCVGYDSIWYWRRLSKHLMQFEIEIKKERQAETGGFEEEEKNVT